MVNISTKGKQKTSIAFYSVLVAIVLTLLKAIVGLATGSLGIISQALDSLFDVGAALMTFFSVRISSKPADYRHQFGHGKVENLSALFEVLLILITCAWIIYEAIQRLIGKEVVVEATIWAFIVMGVSLGLDILISRILYSGARKYGSQALEADALHFSADILTSAVVIAGLIGVRFGIPLLDPIAALIVAVIVIRASVRLGVNAAQELLDQAPKDLVEAIKKGVQTVPGVKSLESLRVRKSGAAVFVDLIVTADSLTPLNQTDFLANEVEKAIQEIVPSADVMVHINPSKEKQSIADRVREVTMDFPEIREIHSIDIYRRPDGHYILTFHLQLRPELSLKEAHDVSDRLEARLKEEIPLLKEIITHLETAQNEKTSEELTISPSLIEEIRSQALTDERVKEIHDIAIYENKSGHLLSFHLLLKPGINLDEAHEVSTEMEEKLKALFTDLERIVIHTEPQG